MSCFPFFGFFNKKKKIWYNYFGYIIFGIILRFGFNQKNKARKRKINQHLYLRSNKQINCFFIFLTAFCHHIFNDVLNLLKPFGYKSLDRWNFQIIFALLLVLRVLFCVHISKVKEKIFQIWYLVYPFQEIFVKY